MIKLDMWYDDKPKQATKVDIFFNSSYSQYSGNIYKNEKFIGDYVADTVQDIQKKFKHLTFNIN
jgi:hypothetical protein